MAAESQNMRVSQGKPRRWTLSSNAEEKRYIQVAESMIEPTSRERELAPANKPRARSCDGQIHWHCANILSGARTSYYSHGILHIAHRQAQKALQNINIGTQCKFNYNSRVIKRFSNRKKCEKMLQVEENGLTVKIIPSFARWLACSRMRRRMQKSRWPERFSPLWSGMTTNLWALPV